MAFFRFHGSNHEDLVGHLKKNGVIRHSIVEDVMLRVDRGAYAPCNPYADGPQGIGFGTTISAPHMHAHALENLKGHLVEGCRALDVDSGTGYLTVCMALMVGESGKVFGIDHIPDFVNKSIKAIKEQQPGLIESGRITIIEGDGRIGYEEGGPYNAIHVGAAAPKIPKALLEQLCPGGRIFMPIGPAGQNQNIEVIDKGEDGSIKRTALMGVRYGSLGDKADQIKGVK